jgi:hypothetical protein
MSPRAAERSRPESFTASTHHDYVLTRSVRSKSLLKNIVWTASVCVIMAAILGSHFFYASLITTKIATPSQRQAHENYVGEVIIGEGNNCQKLKFDNSTGVLKDRTSGFCNSLGQSDQSAESLYRHPTNRLEAVRRGFTNR